jgi:hypothetical protein
MKTRTAKRPNGEVYQQTLAMAEQDLRNCLADLKFAEDRLSAWFDQSTLEGKKLLLDAVTIQKKRIAKAMKIIDSFK